MAESNGGPNWRKLRHLCAISIRNLLIVQPRSRQPWEIARDNDIVKLRDQEFAQPNEALKLPRTRSAQNLPQTNETALERDDSFQFEIMQSSRTGPTRRRSTLTWPNESPTQRQKHLKEATSNRRADVFFSLHTSINSPPFYISETIVQTMNADFASFNLSDLRIISRLAECVLKIWGKPEPQVNYVQILEMSVDFSELICLGKSLDDLHNPLMDNAVIFHFTDGLWGCRHGPENLQKILPQKIGSSIMAKAKGPATNTSSFDSLMQLRNVTECIDDALRTREALAHQIAEVIEENKVADDTIGSASTSSVWRNTATESVNQAKRELRGLRVNLQKTKNNLAQRYDALADGKQKLEESEKELRDDVAGCSHLRSQQEESQGLLRGQIRRIAQRLSEIYPIEPIPNYPTCFTIGKLYLPNAVHFASSYSSQASTSAPTPTADEDNTAAALGLVTHIIDTLATKLFIALPYPLNSAGSSSSAFDRTSPSSDLGGPATHKAPAIPTPENSPWRVFYLNQKSGDGARFRWGVYMVNKCIEEIMRNYNIKIVDPRETLGNLKYLLVFLSSGKGDMPLRKAGVVKGLKMDKESWQKTIEGLKIGGETSAEMRKAIGMERPAYPIEDRKKVEAKMNQAIKGPKMKTLEEMGNGSVPPTFD